MIDFFIRSGHHIEEMSGIINSLGKNGLTDLGGCNKMRYDEEDGAGSGTTCVAQGSDNGIAAHTPEKIAKVVVKDMSQFDKINEQLFNKIYNESKLDDAKKYTESSDRENYITSVIRIIVNTVSKTTTFTINTTRNNDYSVTFSPKYAAYEEAETLLNQQCQKYGIVNLKNYFETDDLATAVFSVNSDDLRIKVYNN